MFIAVVRRYLNALPGEQTGWLAGLRDRYVGHVLGLLHARPAHPWTIDELAREAGMSRSSLAERFVHFVGQPPMQYLTQWRMQMASDMLGRGSDSVARIAAAVGYDSEAAFNRAFKKIVGTPPGAWRRTQTLGSDDFAPRAHPATGGGSPIGVKSVKASNGGVEAGSTINRKDLRVRAGIVSRATAHGMSISRSRLPCRQMAPC